MDRAGVQLRGHYYWGSKPVAFYTTASGGGAATHFEHQDWLGTERMRTAYNASTLGSPAGVDGSYASLPWGDSQTQTKSGGSDQDASHFAALDTDNESNTEHAQFRQYSSVEGRWLKPDPYSGSYDYSNPQSLNRYVYAANNPLSNIDPSGLNTILCDYGQNEDGSEDLEDADSIHECTSSDGTIVNVQQSITVPADGCDVDCSPVITIMPNGLLPLVPLALAGPTDSGQRSGYESLFCLGDALKSNGLNLALDAIGLIPEGGAASAAVSLYHGAVGVSNGTKTLQAIKMGTGIAGTASAANDAQHGGGKIADAQALAGVASIGVGLGKVAPVYGEVLSGISLGLDGIKTYKDQSACEDSGKYN